MIGVDIRKVINFSPLRDEARSFLQSCRSEFTPVADICALAGCETAAAALVVLDGADEWVASLCHAWLETADRGSEWPCEAASCWHIYWECRQALDSRGLNGDLLLERVLRAWLNYAPGSEAAP